jgi:hypothetical protein
VLKCDERIEQLSSVGPGASSGRMQRLRRRPLVGSSLAGVDGDSVTFVMPPSHGSRSHIAPKGLPTAQQGPQPADECARMVDSHAVVVGVSWGSLPLSGRERWTQLRCDQQMQGATSMARSARPQSQPVTQQAVHSTDSRRTSCVQMQAAHRVRVGQTWGTLPINERSRWTSLGCDRLVK